MKHFVFQTIREFTPSFDDMTSAADYARNNGGGDVVSATTLEDAMVKHEMVKQIDWSAPVQLDIWRSTPAH